MRREAGTTYLQRVHDRVLAIRMAHIRCCTVEPVVLLDGFLHDLAQNGNDLILHTEVPESDVFRHAILTRYFCMQELHGLLLDPWSMILRSMILTDLQVCGVDHFALEVRKGHGALVDGTKFVRGVLRR